jgi:hypothetical protein
MVNALSVVRERTTSIGLIYGGPDDSRENCS